MKVIAYDIKGTVYFDTDVNTEIEDILDYIRGTGKASVVDVRVLTAEEHNKELHRITNSRS